MVRLDESSILDEEFGSEFCIFSEVEEQDEDDDDDDDEDEDEDGVSENGMLLSALVFVSSWIDWALWLFEISII